jgi:hypothetical protein
MADPDEFLSQADKFKYEVLAREERRNQTAVEGCFLHAVTAFVSLDETLDLAKGPVTMQMRRILYITLGAGIPVVIRRCLAGVDGRPDLREILGKAHILPKTYLAPEPVTGFVAADCAQPGKESRPTAVQTVPFQSVSRVLSQASMRC